MARIPASSTTALATTWRRRASTRTQLSPAAVSPDGDRGDPAVPDGSGRTLALVPAPYLVEGRRARERYGRRQLRGWEASLVRLP